MTTRYRQLSINDHNGVSIVLVIGSGLIVCAINALILTFTRAAYTQPKPPPDPAAYKLPLPYRIYPDGFLYSSPVPSTFDAFADEGDDGQRSLALLYEDDRLLPLPRTQGYLIAQKGLGRYSHQGRRVYFSSSDNTDPRSNGRSYWLLLRDRQGRIVSHQATIVR